MCSIDDYPIEEELRASIVDYPTGVKLIRPSSAFENFEDWQQHIKDAPWIKRPDFMRVARIHDLATERRKRS